jgi:two-component system NtrC family sensor kinase
VQELVASLRSYSRGEDGRGPLINDVDVAGGIDDALRLLSHRMANVSLRREYAATPGVTARPGELQQVWTNLLANALDAMGDQGHLTVLVGPSGTDRVSVRIVDNGPGIASELREKIFAPRFTTKNGRVQFGLGLGLSISRQIITDHGGVITLDSVPGRTEFTVELPQGERATGDPHE